MFLNEASIMLITTSLATCKFPYNASFHCQRHEYAIRLMQECTSSVVYIILIIILNVKCNEIILTFLRLSLFISITVLCFLGKKKLRVSVIFDHKENLHISGIYISNNGNKEIELST